MENGTYITDVINMAISVNSPMGKSIVILRQNSSPHRPKFMHNLIDTVITSESSCRTTYRDINSSLLRCEYLSKSTIPESDRIALTRI